MRLTSRNTVAALLLVGSVLLQAGCAATQVQAQGYASHPAAERWIREMAAEGFTAAELQQLLTQAQRQESILQAIARPAEKRLNWGEYRNIFIQPDRISHGVAFWQQNAEALTRAEQAYGVPAEVIVAIIGVETRYGRIMGNYRVLDALATLGFDYPPRGAFFQQQLKEYLHLVREERLDPLAQKGSYAGAMGYGQFIPSSYRSFAVDFDGDGKRDIWRNTTDAIGSVANYFARHGWKSGDAVISPVVLNRPVAEELINAGLKPELSLAQWREKGVRGPELADADSKATLMRLEAAEGNRYLLGLHNFYVITRYNHSRLYAMAVHELSQEVKAAYRKTRA